jgi:hypothetical protein
VDGEDGEDAGIVEGAEELPEYDEVELGEGPGGI